MFPFHPDHGGPKLFRLPAFLPPFPEAGKKRSDERSNAYEKEKQL